MGDETPRRGHKRTDDDQLLTDLLSSWVHETWPDDTVKQGFIRAEVEGRLQSYRTWAKFWRYLQISTWLLVAILGLLIAVFAGLKTGQAFTIIAGALVATFTTLTNALHPARQADGYLTGRLALRDEGWDVLNHVGIYAGKSDADAFEQFVGRVRDIVKEKRASTSLDSLEATNG